MEKKILITGGSGLLGSELKKLIPQELFPTSKEFNITNYYQMDRYIKEKNPCQILHCAALTSPPRVEEDPIKAIEVNIIGTSYLTQICSKHNIRLVYISTDYVFDGLKGCYKETDPVNPINKYAWSKLGGETAVRMYNNSLIIRLSFGPKEFPYPAAFTDQWTSRERVDNAARKIIRLLKSKETGIIHIGSKAQSVYNYAKELNPEKLIDQISIHDVNFNVPENTTLNTSKYKNLFENNGV